VDNYKKEVTTDSKVQFRVGKNGELEFLSNGLDEWQQTEAISQARTLANSNGIRQQKITEIQSTTAIASHVIMASFLTLVVFGTSFSCSRLVSTQFNQSTQTMEQSK
jgi:hypothetical protein